MTPRRFLDLVIMVSLGLAIVVGLLAGLRALVGRTGIGFLAIDAVYVPGDWFMPTRVALIDDTTVRVEGVTAPLVWSSDRREWGVSGRRSSCGKVLSSPIPCRTAPRWWSATH